MELTDRHGAWQEDPRVIETIAIDYFSTLFTTLNPSNWEELNEVIEPVVSNTMNDLLTRDFQPSEVVHSLNQMHPTSAPSPDGMPPLLYQTFWPLVGDCVTKSVLDFLNLGVASPNFNETNIILIPKIKNPSLMTDFKPISLCNVVYKLASKILANSMKSMLSSIVSGNQSAFTKSRFIADNVLVAFETMHHISQKQTRKVGDMVLKLDMSKAYDRIEWACLKNIMLRLSFHRKLVVTIMSCVSSVVYFVCINKQPCGPIIPSQGLHQGDHLSSYLFLLCAEGLSALLRCASKRGLITSISVSHHALRITHLFFADDSLIFYRATLEECLELKRICSLYEKVSSQQFNRNKTALFFSKNTPQAREEEIKRHFDA